MIHWVIFHSHATDEDAHIVKILLKVMFLQAAAPRTRSIFDFQQIVRPRMLYILLNVNAVICNTSVKLINKFLNVWTVIDLISTISIVKAMLQMLHYISIHIHILLQISVFFQLMLLRMRWLVCARKLIGYINLIPCTLKAWIPNYCTMFSSSLATIVCSYYYFFVYMHFIGIIVSYTIQ